MEWYIKYGSAEAIPHYNCSLPGKNATYWENQGKTDIPLGIIFVVFGCFVELMYILVLRVIVAKNMIALSCYKIIFSLGMYDIAATFIICIITGYFLITGAVYCTAPNFQYVSGCFALSRWCGACLTALLLVVNRLIDLWKPHLMDMLFDGNRTLIWLLAPLAYCTYFTMILISAMYHSPSKAWLFNPIIPGNDKTHIKMLTSIGRSLVSQVRRTYAQKVATSSGMLKISPESFMGQSVSNEPKLIVHTSSDALSDHNKPISLVLGFDGALPKHVEKYVDIYREMNFPCLSYTGIDWFDHTPETKDGAVFAPLFEDPTLRDRKLIIHTLSMNGFLSLAKLYRWMEQENVSEERIAGILFDSSPSVPRHVGSPMEVRYSWMSESQEAKLNPESVSNMLLFHYVLEKCKLPHHQHYIYSKADKIIDYTHIEAFIQAQINKGCYVTKTRYEDVDHVRHINADITSYKQQVAALIKRSLESFDAKL